MAEENLRDLVVSLSLDGDNFSRNIKSINAQIREAESEFKAAGAGVSDFEGTLGGAQAKAQMLAQKLGLQGKAVEQYSRALESAQKKLSASYQQHEALSRALDEARQKHAQATAAQGEESDAAKEAAKEIEKLEGQLKANERQLTSYANAVTNATTNLNKAKAAVQETEQALNDANEEVTRQQSAWTQAGDALSKFSSRAKLTGGNLTDLGKKLTVGVTAPISAIGVACYKAFGEVDEGLDTVITKTGASGKALDGLKKSYENVLGSIPVTGQEAGTAIGEVNTRFQQTGKTLEDTSRLFLQFAKINGVDLNSSIDDVDTLMTKFGADASEVAGVLGYLTKAGQDTGISVGSLMSSLKSNGSALIEMGFGLSESITLLARFEENGIDAGTALTGLKKAVQEAAKGGRDANRAFTETLSAIKTARSETEAMQLAMELFGSRGAAEMVSAIRSGRLSVEDLTRSMAAYAGTVEGTFSATLDLPDKARVALNKLKIAGSELAATAMTALEPVLTKLMEKAQGLLEKLQNMDEGTKERIVKIAGLVAIVGPALSLIGKLTGGVGAAAGMLGKFAGAVGVAGGGLKGLGAVLGGAPALWIALAGGVAFGTYKLIDFASGAKAAHEALEKMNKAAKDWKNNAAETFYSTSKGLEAFGVGTDAFQSSTQAAYKWLRDLTREWSDELRETDETVQSYVDSFTQATSGTREGLKALMDTAQKNGYDELYAAMQLDVDALDAIDRRVGELIKKRQESFLTDEDILELQSLIESRQEISVKYKLTPEDRGFSQITDAADAALSRAKATGQDTAQIYKDALVASAQGMAEVNKQINAEYDERYQILQLMDDQTQAAQKAAAMEELNAWYAQERYKAGQEYAKTMGKYVSPVWNGEDVKQTTQDLSTLYSLLTQYQKTGDIQSLSSFTEGLSEDKISEYYGLMTQINSLLSQGLGTEEVAKTLDIDPTDLATAWEALSGINGLLGTMNTDKALAPLREMFGESLSQEMLEISTTLNMDGAKAAWEAFAKDPGSEIMTDAVVNGYKEQEGGADKSAIQNPVAGAALVTAYAKASGFIDKFDSPRDLIAKVKAYAKAEGFDGSFEDPANLIAYVAAYAKAQGWTGDFDDPAGLYAQVLGYKKAEGWTGDFDDPAGLYAQVLGYQKAEGWTGAFESPKDLIAYVAAYGKAQGWTGAFDDPTGLTAQVLSYAKAQGWDGSFDDPTNLIAYVSAYAKAEGWTGDFDDPAGLYAQVLGYKKASDFVSTFAPPEVTGSVTLSDLDENALSAWRKANAGKVELTSKINAKAGDTIDFRDLDSSGLLKLYGPDGLPVKVTPGVVGQLDANSLVAGVDKDGVYHVIVRPTWADATEEDVHDAAGGFDPAVYEKLTSKWDKFRGARAKGLTLDALTGNQGGLMGVAAKAADWLVGAALDVEDFFVKDLSSAEIQEFADATAMLTNSVNEGEHSFDAYSQEAVQFLNDMADATDAANASGKNMQLVNATLNDLAAVGVDLTASELPEYLKKTAQAMEGMLIPSEAEIGAGLDKLRNAYTKEDMLSILPDVGDMVKRLLSAQKSGTQLSDYQKLFIDEFGFAVDSLDLESDAAQLGLDVDAGLARGIEEGTSIPLGATVKLADAVDEAARGALGAHSPAARIIPIGLDIAEGMAAGITSGTSLVTNAIVALANAAVAAAKDALDIHSPSGVFRDEIGRMAMRGFGEGIKAGSLEQARVVRNAAGYLTGEAATAVYGSTVNNYQSEASISFAGATFQIREQQDIHSLAREIAALTKSQQTARGAR